MKNKFILSSAYLLTFIIHSNLFAAKQSHQISDAEKLYKATLEDCLSPQFNKLQELLSSGILIDTEETIHEETKGFTTLHMASYYGLCQGIPRLLQAGSNINKQVGFSNKNFTGMTALQIAIIRNLPSIVHALLENGANLDIPRNTYWFSTLFCFQIFIKNIYENFLKDLILDHSPIYKTKLLEIAQKEVFDMAIKLLNAGLEFDQDIKDYAHQKLDMNLDDLKI